MLRIKYLPLLALILCLLLPLLVLAKKAAGGDSPDDFRRKTLSTPAKPRDRQTSALAVYQRAKASQLFDTFLVVVPPAAFTSDGVNPDAFHIDPDYGYLHALYTRSNLWAPLYLPRDAVISSLEVDLEDWDGRPGYDVCVYLDRMDLETGDYECCLIEVCSYGGEGEYVKLVENAAVQLIANDRYAYQLNIYGLCPETYIFGMRVGYGFAEHLPAVMSD